MQINIWDISATVNKYKKWSGRYFRLVASIVFGVLVVETFLFPMIDTVCWSFGAFLWLFVYALAAVVFYVLAIFDPREWIERL